MKYFFIINGRADRRSIADEVQRQLDLYTNAHPDTGDSYAIYITKGIGDATRFVRIYCDLHDREEVCFVAVGGDGMLNDVATGLVGAGSNKSMALLKLGCTNNDFTLYYPHYDFAQVASVIEGTSHKLDIIRINDNYALNVCCFGFDSVVATTAANASLSGKKNGFLLGMIKGFLLGRYNAIQVWADGERLNRRYLTSCSLANCTHVGNGIPCAPRAKNDDGLIEVCLFKTMSLVHFLVTLKRCLNGSQLDKKDRKTVYRQARQVIVKSRDLVELCIDGNMLPGSHFDIEILPQAITMRLKPKTANSDL